MEAKTFFFTIMKLKIKGYSIARIQLALSWLLLSRVLGVCSVNGEETLTGSSETPPNATGYRMELVPGTSLAVWIATTPASFCNVRTTTITPEYLLLHHVPDSCCISLNILGQIRMSLSRYSLLRLTPEWSGRTWNHDNNNNNPNNLLRQILAKIKIYCQYTVHYNFTLFQISIYYFWSLTKFYMKSSLVQIQIVQNIQYKKYEEH